VISLGLYSFEAVIFLLTEIPSSIINNKYVIIIFAQGEIKNGILAAICQQRG